jgi:hypothetical protein
MRRVAWVAAVCAIAACVAETEQRDRFGGAGDASAAAEVCAAIEERLAECPGTSCESAVSGDCGEIAEVMSESFLLGLRDCLDGGSLASCIGAAVSASEPTPSHESFVSAFCAKCAVGMQGCDALLGDDAPEALAPVRSLLSALDGEVVDEVTARCTDGPTCGADLAGCVESVLADRALPDDSVHCTIDMLMSPPVIDAGCTNPSSSSASSGAGAGPGAGGGPGGSGGGGSGGAPTCANVDSEPNGNASSAVPLGTLLDCDAAAVVYGTVAGSSDADVFRFTGYDDYCWAEPSVSLTEGASNARLCMFFQCLAGETEVTCPVGTTAAQSPEGQAGCCGGAGGFTVTTLNCTGTISEDVNVYVRVDEPNAPAGSCHDYTLTYEY